MCEPTTVVMNNFIQKGCFNCAYCKELMLSMPIMIVENVGSVCGWCYEHNFKDKICLRNTALEIAMQECNFPCRFADKGCEKWLNYSQLVVHENECLHRSKKCPMFKMTECLWEGFPSELKNHFIVEHGDHIINFENNLFFLQTSIAERELVKLLVMKQHMFVLRMQTNLDKNKLYYVICNIRDDVPNYDYSVKHKGTSENYIKAKSKVLTSSFVYADFDEGQAVNVDLEALKQTVNVTDTITNIFKIKVNEIAASNLEEMLLQHFECPVCKCLMKPPIYQCQSGHSVCNTCRPRLEICPTCRSLFGGTRNYALEGLTSQVQYPCAYHELGCVETFSAAEITRHEESCPRKPFPCPFSTCALSGNQHEVVRHLMSNHPDQVIMNNENGYTECFRLEQHALFNQIFDRKILLAYGHIFRMTCKRISDYCLWAAEIIGSRDKRKEFIYEVSIIDMRRPEKKLIRTDYCLRSMADEELFKKCIMFPNSILSAYSSNGTVTFHFEIMQRQG